MNTTEIILERVKRSHVSFKTITQRCIYLHYLNPLDRCEFVRGSHCDEESEFFMYHLLMFCGIPNPSFDNPVFIFAIFGTFVYLILLFLILGLAVDEYFCPSLGMISNILGLSENLAGVTLLALGNGAPDMLASLSSALKGDTIFMYNHVLGSGMFVTNIVAGCVVLARPFYLQPFHFLRDTIFTFVSIAWVEYSTSDEIITIWEASSFIVIYIIYIICVIVGYFMKTKVQEYMQIEIDKADDVDWRELRRRDLAGTYDSVSDILHVKTPAPPRDEPETYKTLFQDFFSDLNPIKKEAWDDKACFGKIILIIESPFLLLLRLCIPIVDSGHDRNGWSKLLNSFHCLVLPFLFILVAQMFYMKILGVSIFAFAGPVGLVLALIVFFTSKQNTPPPYHKIFALIAFISGIAIIFFTVKEVVAILNLFGTFLNTKPQTLGLTALAWGSSMGDAIACIQIARQGFQRMAFASCFAGVLANMLITLGITFIIRTLQTGDLQSPARGGVMGPVCSSFFVINSLFSIAFVLLTNFEARRSYGIFLLLMYGQFIFFTLISEVHWIHPLGSDHEFEVDIFKDLEHH